MERGRQGNGTEQRIYGDNRSSSDISASPVRKGGAPEKSRNKRIANAYGASMIRPKKKTNNSGAHNRSRSNSREPRRARSTSRERTQESRHHHQSTNVEPRKPSHNAPAARQQSPPRNGRKHTSHQQKPSTNIKLSKATSSGKSMSAENKILAATSSTRTVNQGEENLDYESLQTYIEELKHKMQGSGGTTASVSVHQLSKVKKRIFDAMTHEQKVAAMLKQGKYKPSSNLLKGGQPKRKKHQSNATKVEPKYFQKNSSGAGAYGQTLTRSGQNNKNQWGEWLNDFEADNLKWLESNAWYCRPGPSSGKMERAFNNYGNEDAGEAGDPYASLRGTIRILRRPTRKQLKPGQKIRRPKTKVTLGRNTIIRNDGRR